MKYLIPFLLFANLAYAGTVNNPNVTGAAGGILTGTYPNPGFAASPAFTGTLTVPAISTASGDLTVGSTSGVVRIGTGSVPTITSGACGTGTNGTIVAGSRTNAGTVNIGASATLTCTISFPTTLTAAPICVISAANATAIGALVLAFVSSSTTGGFVITGGALASTNFNYTCI